MIGEHLPALEEVTSTKKACEPPRREPLHDPAPSPPPVSGPPAPRPAPPNKLTEPERQHILAVLRSEEYCDLAPAQVWARLLDDGVYLCSISTMYRLLRTAGENRERRRQRTHPARKKPELIARPRTRSGPGTSPSCPVPNAASTTSCSSSSTSTPATSWAGASPPRQTGELAEAFIADAFDTQGIGRDQLTLHADRGSSMTSKPVAQLLVDLGVTRSHSRPSVSNDNPYSEAQFKTLKYCPAFPDRFGSIADARTFCTTFFDHYNHVHRHSGIGLHTPARSTTDRHDRSPEPSTLTAAYSDPARFRHQPPTPPKLPQVAWINQPNQEALIQSA